MFTVKAFPYEYTYRINTKGMPCIRFKKDGPVIKLEMEHLMNLEALIELLLEARDALSPRRRLDLARLEEPEDVVPSSIQKVE